LTNEIKDFSSKNHRILEKIKGHNILEVLQTLPSSLFNIECFSSLTSSEIHSFDIKKAEKMKAKALHAFDLLMNEEVLLERIHSKCVFINQSSKNQESYRKKAINHLTVDLIPTFLPYTIQKKSAKFLKTSKKLIIDMKLNKKPKSDEINDKKNKNGQKYKNIQNGQNDKNEEINKNDVKISKIKSSDEIEYELESSKEDTSHSK